MSLLIRQQQIVTEFSKIKDWETRYKHIIELGKTLPGMPEALKSEDIMVKGCQSQVWLHAEINAEGKICFQADSDALIVKGLIALLLKVYSESTADEILSTPPDFIAQIGLAANLSPSRANGLFSMIKQIMYYATAFKALQSGLANKTQR